MVRYMSHGLTLELSVRAPEVEARLESLLRDLAWVRCAPATGDPSIGFTVYLGGRKVEISPSARELFCVDGFFAVEDGEDFYLTDGSSTFHHSGTRAGEAFLAPSFFQKATLLQRNFWAFALLKLLRPLDIFGLHAAGVGRNGLGVLIIGTPGSGKSTLTIGLIRNGWSYLSDDALLVRRVGNGVEALAFRKNFYVDADTASNYDDLPLGDEMADSYGGTKRRLHIDRAYPAQYREQCIPQVLLFSRVAGAPESSLIACDPVSALKNLLAQSGPQLFDRNTMGRQIDLLSSLVRQCACYELSAGLDLYHDPGILVQLLARTGQGGRWLD